MRILFVSHYFPPEVNAPATRTYEHCVRWAKKGHDVTVITCNPNCPTGEVYEGHRNRLMPQVEVIDGIRTVRVWTFLAANAGRFRRTLNYVTFLMSVLVVGFFQKKPDVLVATSPQFFSGLGGVLLGKLRRVPTVLEVRDVWPASIEAVGAVRNKPMLRLLVGMERLMYWLADHIVTVGPGYRNHIEERTRGKAEITVITNGVDTTRYVPCDRDPTFLSEHELENSFVCSYVGTVGMAHGLEVMIRAARMLREKQRTDIKFCVVGDGAKRRDLERQAKAANVDDLIKFVGLQPKDRIPRLLASSDAVLVHLNGCELFSTVIPSKIFEIMASERPIIMGVDGVARDIVSEASAGLPMIPDDAEDLVRIVERLCDEPSLCQDLSETGRRFVENFYNRDTLAQDYLSLLFRVARIPEPITAQSAIESLGTLESRDAVDESTTQMRSATGQV